MPGSATGASPVSMRPEAIALERADHAALDPIRGVVRQAVRRRRGRGLGCRRDWSSVVRARWNIVSPCRVAAALAREEAAPLVRRPCVEAPHQLGDEMADHAGSSNTTYLPGSSATGSGCASALSMAVRASAAASICAAGPAPPCPPSRTRCRRRLRVESERLRRVARS